VGVKPSNYYQSDRPESGGADRDGERENNRLLELEKERLAVEKSKEAKQPKDQAPETER
jgi:hypothetical protein